MIILGGGVVKHHVCNANLMRNGADYTVFVNTGVCVVCVCAAVSAGPMCV
jgi:deoxyhypusine synthase